MQIDRTKKSVATFTAVAALVLALVGCGDANPELAPTSSTDSELATPKGFIARTLLDRAKGRSETLFARCRSVGAQPSFQIKLYEPLTGEANGTLVLDLDPGPDGQTRRTVRLKGSELQSVTFDQWGQTAQVRFRLGSSAWLYTLNTDFGSGSLEAPEGLLTLHCETDIAASMF